MIREPSQPTLVQSKAPLSGGATIVLWSVLVLASWCGVAAIAIAMGWRP